MKPTVVSYNEGEQGETNFAVIVPDTPKFNNLIFVFENIIFDDSSGEFNVEYTASIIEQKDGVNNHLTQEQVQLMGADIESVFSAVMEEFFKDEVNV